MSCQVPGLISRLFCSVFRSVCVGAPPPCYHLTLSHRFPLSLITTHRVPFSLSSVFLFNPHFLSRVRSDCKFKFISNLLSCLGSRAVLPSTQCSTPSVPSAAATTTTALAIPPDCGFLHSRGSDSVLRLWIVCRLQELSADSPPSSLQPLYRLQGNSADSIVLHRCHPR